MLWRLHRPPPPTSLHSPWGALHRYFILIDDDDDSDDDDDDGDYDDSDDDNIDDKTIMMTSLQSVGIATQ